MMAYDSQFAICVLHNGRVLRENNSGVAYIPYNGEYKVRLKNKHPFLRAKARVSIDGRSVSNLGDFILQAGETLDLERFLDHSMTDGNRFKFVPLSDGRVADPTDHNNGLIKVEFYRETAYIPPKIMPYPIKPMRYGLTGGRGTSCNPTWVGENLNDSVYVNWVDTNSTLTNSITPIADEGAGATIEGGHSGQEFVYGDDFSTESYPVTLTLQLKGLERSRWEYEGDTRPKPRRRRIKYCPGCGAHRRNLEKFCGECGTAYHPRYERERGHISR